MKQDIFESDDGSPVEPPDNIKTLLDDVDAAVKKYLKTAPAENIADNLQQWAVVPNATKTMALYSTTARLGLFAQSIVWHGALMISSRLGNT